MKTLVPWLLGGALVASLSWNWTLLRSDATPASCGTSAEACLDAEGLAPEVRDRLRELCRTSCGESDLLERRANELQAELLASLSGDSVDEAATTRLVEEVAELRRRSLESCVRGILGVRALLSPAEVRALLARCEHGPAARR
jgi:uncharacterized membrane protein